MIRDRLVAVNTGEVTTVAGETSVRWRVRAVRSLDVKKAGYEMVVLSKKLGDARTADETKERLSRELLRDGTLFEEGLVCAGVEAAWDDETSAWKRCVIHGDVVPSVDEDVELIPIGAIPGTWRSALSSAIQQLSSGGTLKEGGGDGNRRSFPEG